MDRSCAVVPPASISDAALRSKVTNTSPPRRRPSKAITPSAKSPPASRIARPASAAGLSTATVALFSVVRGLLIRPLPYVEEERLQAFWAPYDWTGVEFDFVKERLRAFAAAPLADES